jgi:hypothetical protein
MREALMGRKGGGGGDPQARERERKEQLEYKLKTFQPPRD